MSAVLLRAPRPSSRSGRVRAARLTDLVALGDLSRLCHSPEARGDGAVRSLGLPVSASTIGVFSLFRLPLGAFRPHDRLYVYDEDRKLHGFLRVERDTQRDEWTIVELDAVGAADAGDIRYRLVQHFLRDGVKGGAARFHVACKDAGGNVELFMQNGFARYGEERILYRPPDAPLPEPLAPEAAQAAGIRPAVPLDALALSRLYALATPPPVARLEAYRLPDWERQGREWRVPRSSLSPILRFADVEAYVQEARPSSAGRRSKAAPAAQPGELVAFLQVGLAKERQPHYLKLIARPDHDPSSLIAYGLGVVAQANARGRSDGGPEASVVCPVRTYESPVDRRLEETGFTYLETVTLLMKETLVRVAEPAMVPATR
ncbi:MAG TPA: hypothetical protein VFK38_00510 [Candidatus Limnocylindrales bacterium]|nr:hypothetical protein [Candidatus Limnocylindrales bacterium]